MKKVTILIFLLISVMTNESCQALPKGDETIVLIQTSMGDVRIKLYNETPLHRDNFIKLVENGTYRDLLFHRVIKDFMIQGGDPQSKGAPKGRMLGTGDVGYTVPAEFIYPRYFHKRGALSAARQGDETNPKKASSGCQFYVVWGQPYSLGKLDTLEMQMVKRQETKLFNQLAAANRNEIMTLRKNRDQEGLQALQDRLIGQMKEMVAREPEMKLTPEQREAYSTLGGTPHLDGEYTVFGEVIEGLEVIGKIQKVRTDRNDRPEEDVTFSATIDYRPKGGAK